MVRRRRVSPFPPLGRRPPAVKAGGMRVSKKQENGPVEKNAKPPGKEKTSAIASFSKTQNMGVLLAGVLSKTSKHLTEMRMIEAKQISVNVDRFNILVNLTTSHSLFDGLRKTYMLCWTSLQG
ncbi:death-associated protein-like 1 [Balearica regulorum gibbericeps]|uniref:death-associated protein-like 1 n=1 Tax=Balearica regulorum gibbericeps TaxID=100784 RepID=UPI003F5E77F2